MAIVVDVWTLRKMLCSAVIDTEPVVPLVEEGEDMKPLYQQLPSWGAVNPTLMSC